MSIFAGAFSDRFDKKKTMLVCDMLAAFSTVVVLMLYLTHHLAIWHLYAVNAVSGLMNTVQQPASEVATTLLIPNPKGGSVVLGVVGTLYCLIFGHIMKKYQYEEKDKKNF